MSSKRKTNGDSCVNPARFHGNIAYIWKLYFNFSLEFEIIHELREIEQINTGNVQFFIDD